MTFSLDKLKAVKQASGQFIDVKYEVEELISGPEFERKLQKLCEDALRSGDDRVEVILSFGKENRGNVRITLTSSNCMILDYVISNGVDQDNISNIDEAWESLKHKLSSLGLAIFPKPNAYMCKDGVFSFKDTIEHQTYDNKIIINLRNI